MKQRPYLEKAPKLKEERSLEEISDLIGMLGSNVAHTWRRAKEKFVENWEWYMTLQDVFGMTHEEIVFILRDYQKHNGYRREVLREMISPHVREKHKLTPKVLEPCPQNLLFCSVMNQTRHRLDRSIPPAQIV